MAARRGVWLVVALIVIAVVISAAGVGAMWLMGRASIGHNATLVLRLSGDLPENDPGGVFGTILTEGPTVRGVVDALRRAKEDPRVTGLMVRPSSSPALWAKTQEIRDAIIDFRRAGKRAVAFLEFGGDQEYYLATACDRIYLLPTSTLDLNGLASYEIFLRGTLDKVGAYPDLLHIGDYKTAINTFTEYGFTPAHREMAESLNRDTFTQLVLGIAQARRRPVDEIRALINQGPFLPEDALRAGLIDDVAYEDQVADKARLPGPQNLVELEDYRPLPRPSFGWAARDRIALIYATGTIVSGRTVNAASVGSDTLAESIRQARTDEAVKAIVLRIDSPGGSTIASDVIWRELMLARASKPLVVSMSDVAASGGYYIAMPGHVIVAQPGTLTGSIGIFGGKFVVQGTLEKLGMRVEGVTSGPRADMYSTSRPFSEEERAHIEEQMQVFYDQFVEKVAQARGTSPERIDQIAQGRVWTGRQAKALGLVDELGGLDVALRIAKQRAGLAADADVPLVIYPEPPSFYEVLSDPLGGRHEGGRLPALLAAATPEERRAVQAALAPATLFRRGELLALMPFVFHR